MQLSDFDYHLPPERIAQKPVYPRDHARLLTLDKISWKTEEKNFYDLLDILGENDVIVLNKTRVIQARLKGKIESGKEVEVFLHKQKDDTCWDCLVYPWKKLKVKTKIFFEKWETKMEAFVKEVSDSGRIICFNKSGKEFLDIVDKLGETPLPPYIKETLEDKERYQTIFSEENGSVAAPTAGLHFTQDMLKRLEEKWVKIEKVLLHVWLGTFKWVETDNIKNHKMHEEFCEIQADVAKRLNEYKKQGKRIIAVGTTSVRTLESFAKENKTIQSGQKETNIFIYPWYTWKFVDAIITNFHLPKSTLLMLVSSFWWQENIKNAYTQAIQSNFRFFSFWDAMFIY